jgi:hypothetical protein
VFLQGKNSLPTPKKGWEKKTRHSFLQGKNCLLTLKKGVGMKKLATRFLRNNSRGRQPLSRSLICPAFT